MSGFLDVMIDAIRDREFTKPRALQLETGASQALGCRAEHVLRLNGVPISDRRLSWAAFVGSAIDAMVTPLLAEVLGGEAQVANTFKGLPVTSDVLAPPLVIDLKSASESVMARVRAEGPKPEHVAQVHLNAAAAREAGADVQHVVLLYVPRDGELDDASGGFEWMADYDELQALAAWERVQETNRLAVERAGLDPADMAAGLRDKPFHFCAPYCPFVSVCRPGSDVPPAELDAEGREAFAEYDEVDRAEKALQARKKELRPVLARYADPRSAGFNWQERAGSTSVDVAAVREQWEPLFGPLPVKVGAPSRSLVRVKGAAR